MARWAAGEVGAAVRRPESPLALELMPMTQAGFLPTSSLLAQLRGQEYAAPFTTARGACDSPFAPQGPLPPEPVGPWLQLQPQPGATAAAVHEDLESLLARLRAHAAGSARPHPAPAATTAAEGPAAGAATEEGGQQQQAVDVSDLVRHLRALPRPSPTRLPPAGAAAGEREEEEEAAPPHQAGSGGDLLLQQLRELAALRAAQQHVQHQREAGCAGASHPQPAGAGNHAAQPLQQQKDERPQQQQASGGSSSPSLAPTQEVVEPSSPTPPDSQPQTEGGSQVGDSRQQQQGVFAGVVAVVDAQLPADQQQRCVGWQGVTWSRWLQARRATA